MRVMSNKKKNRNKGFFREIEDPIRSSETLIYLMFLWGVIILWIYVAIPEQEKNALIYMIMLIVWGFGGVWDIMHASLKKPQFTAPFNMLGKRPIQAIVYGIVVAMVLGLFYAEALIQPLSVVAPEFLSFLFIVITAPIVEANFFRGMIQPALVELSKRHITKNVLYAGVLATVLQSLIFAFFHINIFGQGGDWVPYFVFGVIATVGVYAFRSVAFEYGLHGVNNYIAWVAMAGGG